MKKGFAKYITSAVFILVIGGFFALNLATAPPRVLESERRQPAAFPELTAESFADASFMEKFDEWAQDSFALRESLRTLKAETVFHIFWESDKGGLYIGDAGAGRFEKIDEEAWRQTFEKINRLAEKLGIGGEFAPSGSGFGPNIYVAVIPDKSIYAGGYMPGYDTDTARRLLSETLTADIGVIDLTDALSSGDFYTTDLHWSQPKTGGVMKALGGAMGFDSGLAETGRTVQTVGRLTGAYAGQIALPMDADRVEYVSNQYINSASASYLDPETASMREGEIYYTNKLTGDGDPYDFFLNGPQPLVFLETGQGASGRTLYLFRDSFGSSLAPLFLGAYERVVLIDLRYIDSRVLAEYVEFGPGADVLFLYSSQILNSPSALLVN